MFHQTGTFNGIDTFSATRFGGFNFNSILYEEVEARSVVNRPDINAHLKKLRQENIISQFFKSGKQEFAARFSSNIDYSKYSKGVTCFSLKASIILQDKMKKNKSKLCFITETVGRSFVHLQSTGQNIYIFVKIWLNMVSYSQLCHFFCHQMKVRVLYRLLKHLFVDLNIYLISYVILIIAHHNGMVGC